MGKGDNASKCFLWLGRTFNSVFPSSQIIKPCILSVSFDVTLYVVKVKKSFDIEISSSQH